MPAFFRLGFRMPAQGEQSTGQGPRAGVRKPPKNAPAGQRRGSWPLWGFGCAAALARDGFARIGES
jgi:hypothetical protein